ncbi:MULTISPECIES: M1 family aminopeptidase [unclassified Lentimicrobium]|uniref:M1 family aminopeptidase n=1 Tax=unclassified Lentimicrobium TaxID=2677434 RepID=UPI001555A20C|nr:MULTISPECIES: M1 family aminopeptidase [unclassified Lentimicrobium]NPD44664.1 hypothetical protein [Lentimicrobium sp. S6]NPD85844.1 hypothetical protein [Lentimicrobium sp. L6]
MKTNHYYNLFAMVVFLLVLFQNERIFSQETYYVPNIIPKTIYSMDLDFDFQSGILTGQGKLEFKNDGKRAIHIIAFDYAINDHQLIQLRQDGSELKTLSNDGKKSLNNPVYFILDKPIDVNDSISLKVHFKRRLYTDINPDEFQHQNLIPRLWWDGIPKSEAYKIKLNKLPDYKIAVSGRYNKTSGYYENDNTKNFGFFFSKKCQVLEEKVNGVLVRVIYPENGLLVAELALQSAREVIPFYIELCGIYPYSFLNIIPGGSGIWGGYPFASGMVVIHGMQFFNKASERHWRWITAHEIGHQYWGEYVLDGDDPSWIWIALGIYADREFSQYIGLSDLRHRGWAEQYLQGIRKGYNTIFDLRPEEELELKFDRNNYVIHSKGFAFISALEMALGKETFQEAYKDALKDFGGKQMGYKEFQKICERQSGEKLDWFFDPWVRSNNYISVIIGDTKWEKKEETYFSTVSVYNEGDMIMPIPIYASFTDGSFQVKMSNRLSRKCLVEFKSSSPIVGATIDPSGYLANIVSPPEPRIEKVISDIQSLSYIGAGEKAYRVFRNACLLEKEDIGQHWYQLGMTLFDGGYYSQSEYAFRNASLYDQKENQFISYCWLGHLQDIQNNRSAAIASYKKALEIWDEDSYTNPQYNIKIDKNWVEERLVIPFSLGEPLKW